MVGREDSYDEVMRKNITVEEGRWLIETAEEECKFDEDRKRKSTYSTSNN